MDLHSHSADASDDAGGTVEGYLKWIVARRKRGYHVDGFVLTEHRQFEREVDYSEMAAQYGVTVLRGAELETDIGHVLVYGVSDELARHFDFRSISLPHRELFRAARETGGFAVAAHAGRPRIGLAHYVDVHGLSPDGVEVIEQLNGGSSAAENERALRLSEEHGHALRRRLRRALRERNRTLPDRVPAADHLDRGAGRGAHVRAVLSGHFGADVAGGRGSVSG